MSQHIYHLLERVMYERARMALTVNGFFELYFDVPRISQAFADEHTMITIPWLQDRLGAGVAIVVSPFS
jgi:hypothetical protein